MEEDKALVKSRLSAAINAHIERWDNRPVDVASWRPNDQGHARDNGLPAAGRGALVRD